MLAIDGSPAAQELIVRVFPRARDVKAFLATHPAPPPKLVCALFPHSHGYLATRIVCNAFVGSSVPPYLNAQHPTTAERRALRRQLAKTATAQTRVVK